MSQYEVYHITRTKDPQGVFFLRQTARIEAPSVFEALYQHRKQCEDQNLETLGGLVTHKIVGGVAQPINPGAKNDETHKTRGIHNLKHGRRYRITQ